MSKIKESTLSSRMNEHSRDLFEEVLVKNVGLPTPRQPSSSAFRRHQFVKSAKLSERQGFHKDHFASSTNHNMSTELEVTLPRTFPLTQTPHYPYETTGRVASSRTSSRPKGSFHTLQGLQYHGSRMHNYNQPPVISSTRELLCLTPNKLPKPIQNRSTVSASAQISKPQKQLQRYREFQIPSRVQSRTSGRTETPRQQLGSPAPSLTPRSLPIMRPHIHYKHSAGASVVVTSALQPRPFKRDMPKSALKSEHLQQYRAQLESYLGPRKKDTSFLARRMAPVLRVVPASRVWVRGQSVSRPEATKQIPAKSGDGSEGASQKKVRFSDQMGLPLTRNMTPTYRRKHSYILRWLETAGRPAPPLA